VTLRHDCFGFFSISRPQFFSALEYSVKTKPWQGKNRRADEIGARMDIFLIKCRFSVKGASKKCGGI
jgi:hypothetical protein